MGSSLFLPLKTDHTRKSTKLFDSMRNLRNARRRGGPLHLTVNSGKTQGWLIQRTPMDDNEVISQQLLAKDFLVRRPNRKGEMKGAMMHTGKALFD